MNLTAFKGLVEGHVGLTKRKRPENDSLPPSKKVAAVSSDKSNIKVNVRTSSSAVKKSESKPQLPSIPSIASNTPFVNLEPADAMRKKLLASTLTLQESLIPSLKRCFVFNGVHSSVGGFMDILRQTTYYDIQNDLCGIVRSFMERKERRGLEKILCSVWREVA